VNYFYEATDGSGQTVLGKIDAETLSEAHRLLTERGYRPQSVAPNPASQGAGVGEGITLMGSLNSSSVLPKRDLFGANAVHGSTTSSRLTQSKLTNELATTANGSVSSSVSLLSAPLELAPVTPFPRPAPPLRISDRGGVSSKDLLLFFQQMAPLVKSGMTVYTALDNLAKRTRNKALSDVAHEMAEAARKGGRITDVMARYPRIFPEHVVGTIRAGELGGFMEIVLGEVAINYEQNIALYRGSWQWKAWVLQAGLALALSLPLFGSVLNSLDMGANLRLYVMRELFILPIFGVLCLLGVCVVRYIQQPHMRRWRDTISLKIPASGDLQRQAALSAFVRMLRKLYNAGIAPIHAWEAAMNTADNSVIRDKLALSYAHMQRGESLANAFAETGLFADNVEQIVVTGELSGEVVESLDQAAQIYQDRVQDAHDRARNAMKMAARVAFLLLTGITVCWMASSCYSSQFSLVEKMFPPDGGP
jgi:type IV pilus assembly protein PilC